MTLTLLFDLDETLLDTNIFAFMPSYFQKLSAYLAPYVPPEMIIKRLMFGTQKMMDSEDPARTLREVFDENFYPYFDVDRDALTPAIESFYDDIFPSIREVTRPIPGAVELVEWAFGAGYRVAIATSPYFPRKATWHRLRWAGLPPEKYPFALISTYEDFHFAKPRVAYFAEALARLGWPDGPVLMVGNDVEQDLIPASTLGLATYHSTDVTSSANGFAATGSGHLAELRAWLGQTDLASLVPSYSSPAAFLAILRSTPAALASLLAPLAADKLAARPSAGGWSIAEILCHMRDVEREVNQPRIQKILAEDDPFISAELTDEWAQAREYHKQDGLSALHKFTVARLQSLETLEKLAPAQWSRKARHAIFGPTPLQELVGFNAEHDRMHIQQIWKNIRS